MGSENCNQSEWSLTQSQDGFRKINSNTLIQMGPQCERTSVELDFSLGLNFKLKMIKHSPLLMHRLSVALVFVLYFISSSKKYIPV